MRRCKEGCMSTTLMAYTHIWTYIHAEYCIKTRWWIHRSGHTVHAYRIQKYTLHTHTLQHTYEHGSLWTLRNWFSGDHRTHQTTLLSHHKGKVKGEQICIKLGLVVPFFCSVHLSQSGATDVHIQYILLGNKRGRIKRSWRRAFVMVEVIFLH